MSKKSALPTVDSGPYDPSWGEPHELTSFEDLLPVRISRITEIFVRIATLAFASSLGIRVTDLRILNVLHSDDEVSVAEISRRARIDKAWISRLVRELEAKDLVSRKPHPTDSRAMPAIEESISLFPFLFLATSLKSEIRVRLAPIR